MNRYLWKGVGSSLVKRSFSTPAPPSPASSGSSAPGPMSKLYRPSDFQKFILVWTKKYKSRSDIPKYVSPDLIERARSEVRIKIANILMLLTALASLGAIIAGKAAAKRGESVHQMNLDWHKQYNEEYERKNENKK